SVRAALHHTYGMTETASHVALRRLNGPERSDYFTALPGIELRQDHRGCLLIRGAVTNQQLITTNDRVELLDAQRFRWLGRADWTINSGGVKVQPEEVERAVGRWLAGRGLARRYFAAGLAHPQLGEEVTLVVEGTDALPGELLDELRVALPRHHAPRRVQYVAEFKTTVTGKLDRRATLRSL
ncbi:MAG: hypothetical protein WBA12_08120, partial [Catalinimonas sp.]